MRRSTERILTTHTGSLARPPELLQMLLARDRGEAIDQAAFDAATAQAVGDAVRRQVAAGIDVVSDGEQAKVGFGHYVRARLTNMNGPLATLPHSRDARDFPEWAAQSSPGRSNTWTSNNGPVDWQDFAQVEKDIAHFKAALAQVGDSVEGFLPAVSPGEVANFFPSSYYPDPAAYRTRLAEIMAREYAAIVGAGLLLQIDAPDLTLNDFWQPDMSLAEFRQLTELNIDAINQAVDGLPADRIRLHICGGPGAAPSRWRFELKDTVDILIKGRVGAMTVVGANPRHEHEYHVWETTPLPDGMILIPGVISNHTATIEHPELVAERITRYADRVGKENVIAGTDCGFSIGASAPTVDPKIAWAKLETLALGARLASERMWAKVAV
jgi:5-methyltetrahydropteroyltriglutamate--homocysteine methyltransferase